MSGVPNVLVVGSGGVGAMAAFALALNKKCNVTLVVRSDFDLISSSGYTIDSAVHGKISHWKPQQVSPSVSAAAEHGPFDFVVVTTKNIPDGYLTCEEIIAPAVVAGETTIVLIQNGIGIEEPMIKAFPKTPILSGVLLIGLAYANGLVLHLHREQLYLAPFENPTVAPEISKARTDEFAAIYRQKDGLNIVHVEASAKRSRWDKLVNNAVFNPVTALTGLDINRCQINGANSTIFSAAMDEIIAIAASDGVQIPSETKHRFLHVADGSFFSSSMLVDLRKNQLVEVEVIVGNALKIAARNGVAAPVVSTLYLLMKMVQFRTKEAAGLVKVNQADYVGRNSDEYPEIFAAGQAK